MKSYKYLLNDFAQSPPDRDVRIEIQEVDEAGTFVRSLSCPPASQRTLEDLAMQRRQHNIWDEQDVADYASVMLNVHVQIPEPLPEAAPSMPARRRRKAPAKKK